MTDSRFFRAPRRARSVAAVGIAVVCGVALVACATPDTPRAGAGPTSCTGWTPQDYANARVIHRLRVFTDPATGDSKIEDSSVAPSTTPLLKTGKLLVQYHFGASSKVQIVYGPPDLDLPPHPAPGRESFLILQGSATLTLHDGTARALVPGDMTTYEDTDARYGHGGRTGPCGYVALQIVP